MKLNWCKDNENHSTSIPADILYLQSRWSNNHNILIIGNSKKYNEVFSKLKVTQLDISTLKTQIKNNNLKPFECILCYHSLSSLNFSKCQKLLEELSKLLKDKGEIYLTLLSKDSYFYKHNIKTDNNLYITQKELAHLLGCYSIKNIEYTKRIKADRKYNPHYYILATKHTENVATNTATNF